MKKLLLIFFLFNILRLTAQEDGQLNLFTASPLAINPAMTGYFQNAKWRAWLDHRDQWSNVQKRGMITETFSFDAPITKKKIGYGLLISNNSSLKGLMNDFSLMGSFGYNNILSKKNNQYFSFGLQFGLKQKSFHPEKLSFDEQYIDGVGYSSSNPNNESFSRTSCLYPDFNAGMLWYVKDRWKSKKPWLGFSVYHLTSPNESFTSAASRLPKKLILNGGMDIVSSRNTSMTPQFLIVNQGNFTQATIGYLLSVNNFRSSNYTTFEIGAFYRTTDAVALTGGFEYMHFKFIFSYEYSITSVSNTRPGNCSVDLTIRYVKSAGTDRYTTFFF